MVAPPLSPAMDKPEWLTRVEAVLEVLNEGVVITNENHRILFANARFVEMTGILKRDLIGFDPSQFYSPQEFDFVAHQIDVEFRHGHNRYAFVLPRKDGGRLPVIISSRTLENSGRRFGIVTFTDISEQVRTAEELRSANAKLQKRQTEIEEDLRLAARVQRSLAPKSLVGDRLSVDSFYHPVHSIGGDFALVDSQDSEHISLLVCDVSGHGIGSALVANRIYSEAAERVESLPHPGNRQLGNVCYRCRCQDRCTTTHDVLCRRWPSPCDGSPSWPESDSPRVAQHDTWRAAGSRGDHRHPRSPAPAG